MPTGNTGRSRRALRTETGLYLLAALLGVAALANGFDPRLLGGHLLLWWLVSRW